MKKAIKLDLTPIVLIGGAGLLGYLVFNKVPPFDKISDQISGSIDKVFGEKEDDDSIIEDEKGTGQKFIRANITPPNKTTSGTSGDLDTDFFRELQRQRDLLGGLDFGDEDRVIGDPRVVTPTGSGGSIPNDIYPKLFSLNALGSVTFDSNGDLVVVPIPDKTKDSTITDKAKCVTKCKTNCDILYGNDTIKLFACKLSCDNGCNIVFPTTSSRARTYKAYKRPVKYNPFRFNTRLVNN